MVPTPLILLGTSPPLQGPSYAVVRSASLISCACAFRAVDDAFIFSVGPLGSRREVNSGEWLNMLALLESYDVSSPW